MPQEPLEQDLFFFIAEHINSYEKLEILLLTSANPHREWLANEVYEKIRTSSTTIERRMKELVTGGFLVETGGEPLRRRFQPKTEKLRELVERLVATYKTSPVRVVEAIYSPATMAIRDFAQAFKLNPNHPKK